MNYRNFGLAGGGRKGIVCHDVFDKIISLENLFLSWKEFKKGKSKKRDVQEFEFNLEDKIIIRKYRQGVDFLGVCDQALLHKFEDQNEKENFTEGFGKESAVIFGRVKTLSWI